MQNFIIGIDTGGTCTDAALVETASGDVLATAKTPTTHHQLSEGIATVLKTVLNQSKVNPSQINGVSISTTLATNSVVENTGARVALFVIGYVKHFKLPVTAIIFLKGGHSVQGTEEEPLELEYLVETLSRLKNSVDAYAVCSAMSIKNPTHELVAEKAISMIDPKPVFCSHRSSRQAGMKERSATAALHAKLMPVMEKFVSQVQIAMTELELSCPLAIVTGEGNVIAPGDAVTRSGETVASGPACSALFGAHSCEKTGLVVDVGGTTTDIALTEDRAPVLSEHGCTIGSWVTHMPSVDMYTGGIGGDSLVVLAKDGTVTLGPTRVIPLAMDDTIMRPDQWIGPGDRSRGISLNHAEDQGKTEGNGQVIDFIARSGTTTFHDLRRLAGRDRISVSRQLEQLAREDKIREHGFTPTDALHVLGLAGFGDRERAEQGAAVLAAQADMEVDSFCSMIVEKTEDRIVSLILEFVINRTWGNTLASFLSTFREHPILDTRFSLKLPLIGVGAASAFFLPGVARKLSTTVTFPDHHEIGNAVGAAGTTPGKHKTR